jgi:hypothetical protein
MTHLIQPRLVLVHRDLQLFPDSLQLCSLLICPVLRLRVAREQLRSVLIHCVQLKLKLTDA